MSSQAIALDLRSRVGFVISLLGTALLMASASAPSPFYPVLQQQIGFSDAVLSGIFAIYAISLLITLLIAGSASDHIGRRPVLTVGFVLLAISAYGFDMSESVSGLLAARTVQGIACGLLLSTLSATIVDLEPPSMKGISAVCNSVIPLLGLALGALVSGLLMETVESPKQDIFTGMILISLVMAAGVWLFPETAPRHEPLLPALVPRVGLPVAAKGAFWRCAPAIFAGWATGGLYLSLGTPLVAHVFHLESHFQQALVLTLLATTGALACFVARRYPSRQIMLFGTTAMAVGTAVTVIGIVVHSLPLYLIALALAGTGFGTCFYGAVRTLVPLATPEERGELFASLFTLSYMAFGVPTVIAGSLVPHLGLTATAFGYGLVIVVMATAAGIWRKYGTAE